MAGDERPVHPRRDRLKQLRAFCYAARLQSISRAAEQIFSSQPAVSQQVRALEEELSVLLFERSGPRISLTPAGERLHRLATPLVEGLDRLPATFAERIRGVPSSALRLAAEQAVASSVLPGFLGRFRQRHPGVRVNVKVADGPRRMSWLRGYDVDVVFAAMEASPPEFEFRPVFSSEHVLITPMDHPLAGRKSVEMAEAAAYPSVTHSLGHRDGHAPDIVMSRNGEISNPILHVDGWDAIKHYVDAGVGIAVVPDVCLTERDRVWRIPAAKLFPPRVYGVLTRRDGHLSLAADWFIRILDESPSS